MRILIFTQYFPPEIGATQTRLETFAAGLAQRGHEVEVICEVPNHPQGVVREGFRGRAIVRRAADGYKVLHVWVRTSETKTTGTRLAFYGSYAAMAASVGMARPRPDVIFASSPPLPVAAAAAMVAARHRVPWVMDVRDLWPAAAVALGELANPRALRAAEWLERRLYSSASAITVVTRPFEEAVKAKCDPSKPIRLIPNGTTRFWLDGRAMQGDRSILGELADRFVWTYAGNVGAAQGLDTAVEAARLLDERFSLHIVGDGPVKPHLRGLAAAMPPGSVVFKDQVSPTEVRDLLRASDALLVPLAADPILRAFVPSKLFDFCAVGRPVIIAAAGEPARLAGEADAAVMSPPGDPNALAASVEALSRDAELRRRLEEAGPALAERFLRLNFLEQLESTFDEVVPARRGDARRVST